VIKQNYRNLVEDEIPHQPAEKEYIASYQRAVTTVLHKMTDEELKEAEDIRDTWNQLGAPKDVQLK